MNLSEFAEKFPCLFHVPTSNNLWGADGLLSTTQLFIKFADNDGDVVWRWQKESDSCWRTCAWGELNRKHRTDSLLMRHPVDQSIACIRDQVPLGNLSSLELHCLKDMTGEEWIETLNDRVYLFPTEPEQKTICPKGNTFREKYHTTPAVFNTTLLPDSLVNRIEFATINCGSCRANTPRGQETYRPFGKFPVGEFGKVKEITVRNGITPEELRICCISQWVLKLLPGNATPQQPE
jgi:hypothetical protein